MQTDRVLFNPYEGLLRRHLELVHADPALCVQTDRLGTGGGRSDIAAGRSARAIAESALFPRRILHDLREAFHRDVSIGLRKTWHQYLGGARKRVIPFATD